MLCSKLHRAELIPVPPFHSLGLSYQATHMCLPLSSLGRKCLPGGSLSQRKIPSNSAPADMLSHAKSQRGTRLKLKSGPIPTTMYNIIRLLLFVCNIKIIHWMREYFPITKKYRQYRSIQKLESLLIYPILENISPLPLMKVRSVSFQSFISCICTYMHIHTQKQYMVLCITFGSDYFESFFHCLQNFSHQ